MPTSLSPVLGLVFLAIYQVTLLPLVDGDVLYPTHKSQERLPVH